MYSVKLFCFIFNCQIKISDFYSTLQQFCPPIPMSEGHMKRMVVHTSFIKYPWMWLKSKLIQKLRFLKSQKQDWKDWCSCLLSNHTGCRKVLILKFSINPIFICKCKHLQFSFIKVCIMKKCMEWTWQQSKSNLALCTCQGYWNI